MVKHHNLLPRLSIVLLTSILLLAAFMRFYRIYSWLIFGMDQEYQALISRNIVFGHHFPLIGVNASDTGIYLGPFFSYLSAAIFVVSKGNPLAGAVYGSLMGVITTLVLYIIVKRMYTVRTAFIAALLYGGSFLTSFYDRQFWNPNPIPLISVLLGFCIWRLLKREISILPWLTVVFGIGIQCHLSIFIFLPLIFFSLYIQRRYLTARTVMLSIGLYLAIQSPWIIFELRHDFINIHAIFDILNGSKQSSEIFGILPRIENFISTLGRLLWTPFAPDLYLESGQCKELRYLRKEQIPLGLLVITGVSSFLIFLYKKSYRPVKNYMKIDSSIQVISGIFILTSIYLFFYSRQSFEYYYLYLFPWVAILIALIADYIINIFHVQFMVWALLVVFVVANVITLVSAKESISYAEKISSLQWAKVRVGTAPYRLESLGSCGRFGGYRYLAEFVIGTPKSSYMDSYFSWLYPETIDKNIQTKTILLDLTDEREHTVSQSWQEYIQKLPMSEVLVATKNFGLINLSVYDHATYALR
jgi:4-amino-4-deoxy-L-arabinose transferase-like glycosyltransferase